MCGVVISGRGHRLVLMRLWGWFGFVRGVAGGREIRGGAVAVIIIVGGGAALSNQRHFWEEIWKEMIK